MSRHVADPLPRPSCAEAIARLTTLRTDVDSCSTYLKGIGHSGALLQILVERFPQAMPADSAALLARDAYGQYRDLEHLLLETVQHYVCELDPYVLDSYVEGEETGPLRTIPVARLFHHEEDFEGFESLISGLQIPGALAWGSFYGAEMYHAIGLDDDDLARLAPAPSVSFDRLDRICSRLRSPLRHLAAAVRVVSGDTGTVFFDGECTCGQCHFLEWSVEAIDMLAGEFQKANALFGEVRLLSDWIDQDPEDRIEQVVRVWNCAARKETP